MGNQHTKEVDQKQRPASAPPRVSARSNADKTRSKERKSSTKSTLSTHVKPEVPKNNEDLKIIKDIQNKKDDKLLVVAIDFGTTYSGYAWCTRAEYISSKGDNSKIYCPTWPREGGGQSYQVPTTILFQPNKTFHSFGFEAEQFYHDNPENEDFKEWYFFKHFKMKLYTDKNLLTKDTIVFDHREAEKSMKAVEVFAAVIRYFKEHLLRSFSTTEDKKDFTNDDIHWILTVPAIWDLKAKQFMKDAAELAGISDDQLTLALEPEAASLYCRKVPVSVETTVDGGKIIATMQKGSKYIVFDQGGGTTDITVHEVTGPDTLKEIHQACGGYCGGVTVNQKFFSFLTRLFGGPVVKEMQKENPSEYFDLMSSFENKKTSFVDKDKPEDKITLRIPHLWIKTYEEHTDQSLEEALPNSTFKRDVSVKSDKIRISSRVFRSFFDYSIDKTLRILEELFEKPSIQTIDTLLAVGGYSESPILINAIKKRFPHLHIIVPRDPGLAVLKGAVIYGFEPQSITERVSRYTYGVAMQLPFDREKHDRRKISTVKGRGGRTMVDDIFDKHVEIGQSLQVNQFQDEHEYFPIVNEQKVAIFEFYASELENPKYTTEEKCHLIGTFRVDLTRRSPTDGKIFLKLNASGTEILAVAREDATGEESRAYFSLF